MITGTNLSALLTALGGLSGTGVVVATSASALTTRTIAGTTGELAVTNGDGISGAPTISLTNGPKLLFRLPTANMATANADQTFTKIGTFTTYSISEVLTVRVSGAYNTACLGGIYTAATKGGSALIAATQTYAALTGASTLIKDTLAAILALNSYTATPILNLSTGNGAALVADILIFGYVLD